MKEIALHSLNRKQQTGRRENFFGPVELQSFFANIFESTDVDEIFVIIQVSQAHAVQYSSGIKFETGNVIKMFSKQFECLSRGN